MIDLPPPMPPQVPLNPVLLIPQRAAFGIAAGLAFLFTEIVFIGRFDNGFWLGLLPAALIGGLAGWLVRRLPWVAVMIALLANLLTFFG